jgi:hypothetical protein
MITLTPIDAMTLDAFQGIEHPETALMAEFELAGEGYLLIAEPSTVQVHHTDNENQAACWAVYDEQNPQINLLAYAEGIVAYINAGKITAQEQLESVLGMERVI